MDDSYHLCLDFAGLGGPGSAFAPDRGLESGCTNGNGIGDARALTMAINLRKPPSGLLHHSARGSQYASKTYWKLLRQHRMISSMSGKDNAPTERFVSSLKREWLTGSIYPTRCASVCRLLQLMPLAHDAG